VKKFGRRKSWLVPIQYLIGIFMFTFSDYVHELLNGDPKEVGSFNSHHGA
jgi:MFS transporter, PAT family, solute carrier family 33 (acetyl-CoA transportor), member 1